MAQPIWSESTKSYSYLEKNNPKDRVEVIVGDDQDASTLFPQVKIKRWDNEVNASIRLVHDNIPGNITYTDDGEKITWSKKQGQNEWKAVFYHRDDVDEGGFEFEIHLPAKPPVNYLDFTVNIKDLDWFYQPALTQQEIDEGAFRPENVVGSYAVYHKYKGVMNDINGMEYKVGKAFHVYRPHVVDANGNETWGTLELNQETGILRISVDQTWLNSAVYPVVVDPTLGYAGAGASNTLWLNGAFLSRGTPNSSVSIAKLSAYNSSTGTDGNIKGLIWDSSKSKVTNALSGAVAITGTVLTWRDLTFGTAASITSGENYYLGYVCDSGNVNCRYDSGSPGGGYSANNYSSPTDLGTVSATDNKYSVYTTYATTVAGTYTDYFTSVGTTSWTAPAGVTSVDVKSWGGGGGGGDGNNNGGGGGGGGAYAAGTVSVTPESSYNVVVGAGGASATSNNASGSAGGDSTFNSTSIVAKGGGAGGNASGATQIAATESTGTVRYAGGAGGNAQTTNDCGGGGGGAAGPDGDGGNGNNAISTASGAGGTGDNGSGGAGGASRTSGNGFPGGSNSLGGGGGSGGYDASYGGDGGWPGGGGGGGETQSTTAFGKGGDGYVTLTYTIPVPAAEAGVVTTTLSVITPTTSYVQVNSNTPYPVSLTLTVPTPTVVNNPPSVSLNSPNDEATITDTTPDLTFTGTDPEGDGIAYNVLVRSLQYSLYTQDTNNQTFAYLPEDSTVTIRYGQALTVDDIALKQVSFVLSKEGSPSATITAEVYAISSGTVGTNATIDTSPTALATSTNSFTQADVTTNTQLDFTFNLDSLSSGNYGFALKIVYTSADSSNRFDAKSSNSDLVGGNRFYRSSFGAGSTSANDLTGSILTAETIIDADSTTDPGFTTDLDGIYPSGDQVTYTVQSALDSGDYDWKVRGKDPDGTNTYGDWATTRSFTVEGAAEATPDPVTTTLSVVTPTTSYQEVATRSHAPLVTTLTVAAATASYILIGAASPDPVSITSSVVTPESSYVSTHTTTPDPVSATLSVISPSTSYVYAATATPNPVSVTLSPVTPTSSYAQVNATTPDPVAITLSVVTPTASYIQIASSTPNPVQVSLTPVSPSATYIQIETATPAPIETTLSVVTPASSYVAIATTSPDPVSTTLTVTATTATAPGNPQATEYLSPGTMANDNTVGTVAWSNLDNAKVNDGNYTSYQNGAGTPPVYSNYLKATNFGFEIPTGATIDGILVEIEERHPTGPNIAYDSEVKIVKANGSLGSENKAKIESWDNVTTYTSYGGSDDVWNETWTAEDINNSNFGVVLSGYLDDNFTSAQVDHIQIKVHYTTSGGTGTATPDPVSLTSSVVTPASSYAEVESTTPNPVTITGAVLTPGTSYVQEETATPDPVSLTASVVTPATGYIAGGTVVPDPLSLTLSVAAPTVSYVYVATTNTSPLAVTLTSVTPTTAYVQVETNTPDPVVLNATLNQITSDYVQVETATPDPLLLQVLLQTVTSSSLEVVTTTPDPVSLTASVVTPESSYLEETDEYTTTPDPVQVQLLIQDVITGYIDVATATLDPVSLTVSVVSPTTSFKGWTNKTKISAIPRGRLLTPDSYQILVGENEDLVLIYQAPTWAGNSKIEGSWLVKSKTAGDWTLKVKA